MCSHRKNRRGDDRDEGGSKRQPGTSARQIQHVCSFGFVSSSHIELFTRASSARRFSIPYASDLVCSLTIALHGISVHLNPIHAGRPRASVATVSGIARHQIRKPYFVDSAQIWIAPPPAISSTTLRHTSGSRKSRGD